MRYFIQREIQALYSAHRTKRNAQQRAKFIDPGFKELIIDQHLLRLEDQSIEPGFKDPRNCLVFWARPPEHVIRLAAKIQELLKEKAPSTLPSDTGSEPPLLRIQLYEVDIFVQAPG